MDDFEFMGVFNAANELLEEPTSAFGRHASVGDDVVEQLASGIFENNDNVCGGRYDFVSTIKIRICDKGEALRDTQFYYMGMP